MRAVLIIIIILSKSLFAFSQSTDTIYFDTQWKKSDKEHASFYREISKAYDSVYSIKDCYLCRKVQMEGFTYEPYSTENEKGFNGYFKYYDSTGYVLEKGEYLRGRRIGKWLLYFKGSKNIKVESVYEKDNTILATNYYASGYIKSKGKHVGGKRMGEWNYYADGKDILIRVEHYVDDILHGEVITYDTITQQKFTEVNYSMGKESGESKIYYRNGKLRQITTCVDGEINGRLTLYDSINGNIIKEGHAVNGIKQGIWKEYYRSGRLDVVYHFVNGKLNGKVENYDSISGYKIFETEFKDDKVNGTTIIYSRVHEGRISFIGQQTDWIFNGESILYHDNGKIGSKVNYKNDLMNGYYTAFDSVTGLLVKEGSYKMDKKSGKWKYYYSNGTKKRTAIYKDGLIDGEDRLYDTLGKAYSISRYDNDEKTGVWEFYYLGTSQLKFEIGFKKDSLHGDVKTYYSSGKPMRNEIYEMGKKLSGKCYTELGEESECYRITTKARFYGDVMIYIGDSLRYPKSAIKNNVEGKIVVGFYVNNDGSLSEAEIVSGLTPDCDKEALRLVSHMPPWKPAEIDGMPYKTYQTLPIVFWIH